MSDHPPLRKPRHADGRLMSEDEIRGLDGRDLDRFVAVCAGGYVEGGFDMERDPGDNFEANLYGIPLNPICPHYSTDIAAAFDVDRPDWVILCGDSDRMLIESGRGGVDRDATDYRYGEQGVRCRIHAFNGSGRVEVVLRLLRRSTPADHAKCRCIAALLLAAKIGE